MSINELKEKLVHNDISSKWYSINDSLMQDAYIFREIHNVYWEVFYMDEKGNQKDYKRFNNEASACEYFFDKLLKRKEEYELWKKKSTVLNNNKNSKHVNNSNSIFYVEPNGNIMITKKQEK